MIGQRLGPYAIQSELGSGGMGKVYLAEVTEPAAGLEPGTRVALKVVHPHLLETPGFFKRFMQEAELGKRVRHENVVRTFDVDAILHEGQHHHYMVMEYVEGRSLRELLLELGTVPEALLREIALQTATGLVAIHAADIVHRDLKPENILITDDREIRIMDLGVAKLQEASIALTREGQFTGSLLYASPEQCEAKAVGAPSDLYALGVLLYELATGKNPFRRDDAVAIIRAHIEHEPPRASDLNPDLSRFLSEVFATLLRKAPADRFASADELRDVLAVAESSAWWAEREKHLHTAIAELPHIQVRRETGLHGRETELAALAAAWEDARSGRGRVVYVEGEAGLGKSRLVDAFLRSLANEDVHILYGSYPPSGGLGGLSDAMFGKFGSAAMAENLAPYMDVTPTLIPAFTALIRHEAAPTGAAPLSGDALHAVVCNIMRALAAEKPTIWIVEDLQFAPADSRSLLLSMARAAEAHRVLLIATARDLPEADLANISRLAHYARIQLGRLGAREVIELLSDAFGSAALAEKLGGKIAYKSDGVPFFVFEMIRGLKEGRFLKQNPDGTYVQTQMITDIEVPSAVRDLIEARLKELSDDDRALLDVAAVQGFEFDADLIARVRELKKVQVLERLAALERRHGVIRSDAAASRFDHYQLQEILYRDLMPELRAEYHTLLADAFVEREELEPDDVDGDEAYFVVRHHLRGSRPKAARPYVDAALGYLERAHQHEAAVDLAQRALDARRLLKGADRVGVLLRVAGRLGLLGRLREQREALDRAVTEADAVGDGDLRSTARARLALWMVAAGELEKAEECAKEALELADDDRLEAEAYGVLGIVDESRGHYEDALEKKLRQLDLSKRIGDEMGECLAETRLGFLFWVLGRYGERKERHERALQLAKRTGNRSRETIANHNVANVLSDLGNLQASKEYQERAIEQARESGFRLLEGVARFSLGVLHERSGDIDSAVRHYEDSLAMSRDVGYPSGQADALIALARARLGAGDAAQAQQLLDDAVAIGSQASMPGKELLARAWRAVATGRDAESAVAAFESCGTRMPHHEVMEARFVLWKATGDAAHLAEAKRLLGELSDHAPEESREAMIENIPLHREIESGT